MRLHPHSSSWRAGARGQPGGGRQSGQGRACSAAGGQVGALLAPTWPSASRPLVWRVTFPKAARQPLNPSSACNTDL